MKSPTKITTVIGICSAIVLLLSQVLDFTGELMAKVSREAPQTRPEYVLRIEQLEKDVYALKLLQGLTTETRNAEALIKRNTNRGQ